MGFLTYPLVRGGEITAEYLNQHFHENMNILHSLILGSESELTIAEADASVPGATSDWQVISVISAGELNADVYFKWSASLAAASGDIEVDVGWRRFGSADVTLIASNVTEARPVAFRRLLHSAESNQGIIEVVANNTATAVRVPAPQWSVDWSVRYRWEWTEATAETETYREPYEETYQSGTRIVRQAYTERVCRNVPAVPGYAVYQYSARLRGQTRTANRRWYAYQPEYAARGRVSIFTVWPDLPRGTTLPGGGTIISPVLGIPITAFAGSPAREVCTDETRYRNVEEPIYSTRTAYREQTRTVTRMVTRMTEWTTVRSGTSSAETQAEALAAAQDDVDAVSVQTSLRPAANAVANIERTVGDARDTSTVNVQPAGTAMFTNIAIDTHIILGAAEKA